MPLPMLAVEDGHGFHDMASHAGSATADLADVPLSQSSCPDQGACGGKCCVSCVPAVSTLVSTVTDFAPGTAVQAATIPVFHTATVISPLIRPPRFI
jgi:hypothetical protein